MKVTADRFTDTPSLAELYHSQPMFAVMSPCGRHRYALGRRFVQGSIGRAANAPPLVWVMCNPSKADERVDDPTIRKVIGFSQRLGAGGVIVVNLYSLRATDPQELFASERPCGVDIDLWIGEALSLAGRDGAAVAAWGSILADGPATSWAVKGYTMRREQLARVARVAGVSLVCLGRTRRGEPRHPLMLGYNITLPLETWAP